MPSAVRVLSRLLVVMLVTALYVSASTYRTPLLWPTENDGAAGARVDLAPTVPRADRLPGCHAGDESRPEVSDLVVVRLDGSTQRMRFDEAWRRTHDASHADDVWVVGVCPAVARPTGTRVTSTTDGTTARGSRTPAPLGTEHAR